MTPEYLTMSDAEAEAAGIIGESGCFNTRQAYSLEGANMTPENIIPQGFCQCGCGQKTAISSKTRSKQGCVKGQPVRYIQGHTSPRYDPLRVNPSATPTYQSWSHMITRATNPNHEKAHCYIGRGITVCERWLEYDNFVADMGLRPEGTTIDRIDVDGNYEPGNCRWATWDQQCRNRRTNVILVIDGVSRTISEWSEVCGFSRGTIYHRLKRGMTPEEAISTPLFTR